MARVGTAPDESPHDRIVEGSGELGGGVREARDRDLDVLDGVASRPAELSAENDSGVPALGKPLTPDIDAVAGGHDHGSQLGELEQGGIASRLTAQRPEDDPRDEKDDAHRPETIGEPP